ncbi:MAG: methylase [Anaerolineae bacterium]|nr:methylase [Anaerolineae bacterium]
MNITYPRHAPKKPLGQITRGKTARNRLRPVDNFFLKYDPGLLTRCDGDFAKALFVDLGYGAEAVTTLETASRLRRLNPGLGILGIEIEADRVARALPFADERTFFRLGGFNIPLLPGEYVRAIRAFNVLRQYEEADVLPAWAQMARGVLPGGLLVEGTSNPFGSILAANVLRRVDDESAPWRPEALVFYTNFRLGFDPAEFQTILPKNYIHRVVAGETIYNFFEAWKASAAESAPVRTFGLRPWFVASAEGLSRRGYRVRMQKKWLNRGWLVWEHL